MGAAHCRLHCRLRHVHTTMRHRLSHRKPVLVRIEFVRAITVLLGRIVEKTSAALEIGAVIGRAAGHTVNTEQRRGHGEFRDESVGGAVRNRGARDVHVAGLRWDVLRGRARTIETLIECAKNRFLVDGGGVAAGRIKGTTCGKDHIAGRQRSILLRSAGDVVLAYFGPWAEVKRKCDALLWENVTKHLGGVPVGFEADGGKEIAVDGFEGVLRYKGRGGDAIHY